MSTKASATAPPTTPNATPQPKPPQPKAPAMRTTATTISAPSKPPSSAIRVPKRSPGVGSRGSGVPESPGISVMLGGHLYCGGPLSPASATRVHQPSCRGMDCQPMEQREGVNPAPPTRRSVLLAVQIGRPLGRDALQNFLLGAVFRAGGAQLDQQSRGERDKPFDQGRDAAFVSSVDMDKVVQQVDSAVVVFYPGRDKGNALLKVLDLVALVLVHSVPTTSFAFAESPSPRLGTKSPTGTVPRRGP